LLLIKSYFFLVANWHAAGVTRQEHHLIETISSILDQEYTSNEELQGQVNHQQTIRQENLQDIRQYLLDLYALGKLGFTVFGIPLTPGRLKGVIGTVAGLVLVTMTSLAKLGL